MGNPRKQLGSSLERRVVTKALGRGLSARQQPLSGQLSKFPNDVLIGVGGRVLLGECKVRSEHPSFNELDGWLQGVEENAAKNHMLGGFLVYNPKGSRTPRVMLDLDLFLRLLCRENTTLDNEQQQVI